MNFVIEENVRLAEHTTLKIGGLARYFVRAMSEQEVIEALEYARQNNLPIFILGGGSNVLIADEGFDGLVLQIALKGISISEEKDEIVCVSARAGEDWDEFCKFCVERNLQGIECLSGIPGLTGGTPVQNVGAYGQDVSETILKVKCFDRKSGKFVELNNAECDFAYRASIFNTTEKNRFIVLNVTFALRLGGAPKIVYRDLINYFGDTKPDLKELRNAVLKIRVEKSMVIRANDPNSRSAGSFFKNPIVAKEKLTELEKRAALLGIESIPHFKVDESYVKIPAAWLIEKSGFQKGYEYGAAGLSTRHTLAIINRGNATANDILKLKEKIQFSVREKFNVELMPEPIFVGFKND
jgi:UDP-N-acetylmuramate dehydrogenase